MARAEQSILVGNLGKDPEVSTLPRMAVAKFSLATSDARRIKKATGRTTPSGTTSRLRRTAEIAGET